MPSAASAKDIYAEDYLFWLLALAHGFRHRHIDQPLSVHRRSTVQKSANAILMRETDLRVITEVVGTGLLSDSQLAAARRSTARLRRNIAVRKILAKTVGPTALERLTARIRSARAGAPAKHAPVTGGLAVAFINNFPGPSLGGGEVQLLALLRGLSAADVRPCVVCAAGSALERETRDLESVDVIPVDFTLRCLPSLITLLSDRLRGGQIIQGTGYLTNLIARLVGSRARMPVVNTVHVVPGAARLDGEAPAVSALRMTLDRLTRRYVTRFVAVSQAVGAGLVADKVAASRITVIPNGVDLAQLRRAALATPPATLREAGAHVGFVGRLERIKGMRVLPARRGAPGCRPSRRALRRRGHGIPRGRAASTRRGSGHCRPYRVPRLRGLGAAAARGARRRGRPVALGGLGAHRD